MRGIETIRRVDPTLARHIEDRGGFILDAEVDKLVNIDRLMLVLVRCGNGRFLCPVQNLKHFLSIISKHALMVQAHTERSLNPGTDYVRDVSLPA